MTIDEILGLDDFKKAVDILTTDTIEGRDREAYREEYNGKRERRATSVGKREDKNIDVYSETETETDADGNEVPKKIGKDIIKVARFKTNAPKRIVRIAASFLFGGEMTIAFADNNDAAQYFKEVFADKLKMKSVLNKFARTVMVETKSAIIFYPRPKSQTEPNELEIKAKILTLKNGDFWPHFDDYGDMDAFVRKYKAIHKDGEEREFLWIQTATTELLYVQINSEWTLVSQKANLAKKITVVYAEQDLPEYEDVVNPIDYYENRVSRVIDTNDYFGDPILKNFGESSLPSKNTVGKQISYPIRIDPETGDKIHGDAEYLVWQQSSESIRLELEVLKDEIFSGSSTPDLSFTNVKGLGAVSGVALELMFMEAFIKSAEKMEIFGPVVQRCVSVVCAMISNITNISIKEQMESAGPKVSFGSILPQNLAERVEMLVTANGGKAINSQETIVGNSPFTEDVEEELKRLTSEASEESERNKMTGLTF